MNSTFIVYTIGALALSGIFPLAGFWSKDEILAHGGEHNFAVYLMLTIAAFCTAFYMGRQLQMVFFGKPRHAAADHAQESSPLMVIPLWILAVLSIVGGFLLNLPFLTESLAEANHRHPTGIFLALEGWLEHSIDAFHLSEEGIVHLPHTPIVFSPMVAGLSTLLAVGALLLAFKLVYRDKPQTADERDPLEKIPFVWKFFAALPFETLIMKGFIPLFNKASHWLGHTLDGTIWHDFVHERVIRDNFVGFASFSANVLDTNGVDGLVNGSAKTVRRLANLIRRSQTGYARNYALSVFLGAVALVAYFVYMAN